MKYENNSNILPFLNPTKDSVKLCQKLQIPHNQGSIFISTFEKTYLIFSCVVLARKFDFVYLGTSILIDSRKILKKKILFKHNQSSNSSATNMENSIRIIFFFYISSFFYQLLSIVHEWFFFSSYLSISRLAKENEVTLSENRWHRRLMKFILDC